MYQHLEQITFQFAYLFLVYICNTVINSGPMTQDVPNAYSYECVCDCDFECMCIFDQQKAVFFSLCFKYIRDLVFFLFDTYSMSHCILWISLRILVYFRVLFLFTLCVSFCIIRFDSIQCLLYLFLRVLMPLVVYHLLCAYLKAVWSFIGTRVILFLLAVLVYLFDVVPLSDRHVSLLFHRIYSDFFFSTLFSMPHHIHILMLTFPGIYIEKSKLMLSPHQFRLPQNEKREGHISQ